MKNRVAGLEIVVLVVLAGVAGWIWLPYSWRYPDRAAIERRGGKIIELTIPHLKGRLAVRLPGTTTDEELELMRELDRLKPVCVQIEGGSVTDRGVASLTRLKELHQISLQQTRITDESLKLLQGFTDMEMVSLDATSVTDRGLGYLEPLSHLHGVSVRGTAVTLAGIERLRAARPGIIINSNFDPPEDD
jgi:hypothetical protein